MKPLHTKPPSKADGHRYLTIPADRRIVTATRGGEVVGAWEIGDPELPAELNASEPSATEFVRHFFWPVILGDASWGTDLDRLYMMMTIRGKVHGRQAGDVVRLSEEEHDAVCAVMRKPGRPYHPLVMALVPEWFEAVLEAPTEAPPQPADTPQTVAPPS